MTLSRSALRTCAMALALGAGFPSAFGGAPPNLREQIQKRGSEPVVVTYDPARDTHGLLELGWDKLREELTLQSEDLENPYFRVVEGQNEQVLPQTDFDGRNVLYHLMKARAFYAALDPNNPALERKITVRVRQDRDYNLVTRFAQRESHNNSRYIHADYRGRWSAELWFHPPKGWAEDRSTMILRNLVDIVRLDVPLTSDGQNSGLKISINLVPGKKYFDPIRDIGMDLAKVPSVIYHEAFHWASDEPYPFTSKTEGHPLKEDFANYFGSVINGAPKIAEFADFVDPSRVRDFRSPDRTSVRELGQLKYNFTNLIPFVLWQIRKTGKGPTPMDALIWATMKRVTATTKPSQLGDLLLDECTRRFEPKDEAGSQRVLPFYKSPECRRMDFVLAMYGPQLRALDQVFKGYYGD